MENPRGGGAWWAAVYGVAQSRTRLKRLSSIILFFIIEFTFNSCIKFSHRHFLIETENKLEVTSGEREKGGKRGQGIKRYRLLYIKMLSGYIVQHRKYFLNVYLFGCAGPSLLSLVLGSRGALCCGAQALGHAASVAVEHGFRCSSESESSWTGD